MPRYTALADELIVNGQALSTLPGIVVKEYPFFAPGTRRGTNDTVPGRRGQISTPKPLDAFQFSIPITVLPLDSSDAISSNPSTRRAQMIANLHGLAAAVQGSGGQLTLTRKTTTTSGYVLHNALGEYVSGLAMDLLNQDTGDTELSFVNLEGAWYDQAYTSVSPGTRTVAGQFSTRRIVLSLPSAGTLNNATVNARVSVGQACTIDVEAFTASAGAGSLTHSGDNAFFVLLPGANVITWSGSGSATIQYKSAYV